LSGRANLLSKQAAVSARDARSATVGGLQILDLLRALGELGLDADALCRTARVDRRVFDESDARIPAAQLVKILAEAERRSGDPFVGLHAGERCEPRGPVAYLIMSHGLLRDGLQSTARFGALIADRLRIDLVIGPDTVSLVFDPHDPTFEGSRHAVEYLLMGGLRALQRASPDLRLHEVTFRHARLCGEEGEAPRAFGAPVRFAAADDRLVFPARELLAASRFANPLVADQLEKFATALAAHVTPPASLRERVAEVTRALVAAGVRADRVTVTKRLGMSQRNLHRGLAGERTTFRGVRDAVLCELVEALLSNPSLKLEAVALGVGFADLATFSKAFRRWTGDTPTRYRARLATSGGTGQPGASDW
jgi:AraC-like DNA-binding protein